MKAVDILGHDTAEKPLFFEPGEEAVRQCRLKSVKLIEKIPGKRVERGGVFPEKVDIEGLFRIVLPGDIDPPLAAEVGNPCCSGDTCSGKGHGIA